MKKDDELCCPEFNPTKWDEKKVTWKKKLFIKDKVFSFFHIPLNFGSVMEQSTERLKEAKAYDPNMIVLSDEKSMFYSNIYLSAKKPIKDAVDVRLSATFLSKSFEGPYKNIKKWKKEMEEYVKSKNQELKHIYFYYPYCPKCAKKYGHNYVVILAEI